MLFFFAFALFSTLSSLTLTCGQSDPTLYHETSISLEHYLSNRFLGRSTYVIKHKGDGSHDINVIDSSKNMISLDQLPQFKSLLSNKDIYRIQVLSHFGDGSTTSVSAAIPACDLQQSGFKEDIVLHLDNDDKIMSVSYSSPKMAISQACNANKVKQFIDKRFISIVLL